MRRLTPVMRPLELYCRRSLCAPGETADVLQSAIANAFRDFRRFADGTNFRAWIFRYVAFEALNRNRAARRTRTMELLEEPAGRDPPPAWMFAADLTATLLERPGVVLEQCDDALTDAIGQLPEIERSIFLLRSIGDFKYREIAEILDIPLGAVIGRLARARDRLRQSLRESVGGRRLLAENRGVGPRGPDHSEPKNEEGAKPAPGAAR